MMPPGLRPEDVLATILSSTEEGLLSFSIEGLIQCWSRGAEQLYGHTAVEAVGQPITILLPICEGAVWQEFLRTARTATFAGGEDAERLRKDGSHISLSVKRAAIRDRSGAVTGILEIASKKDRHAPGLAGDGQLRCLVDQMPAILWTTDQHLRITSNWGAGLGMPKIKAGDLVGRTLYDYLKCQDPHATPMAQHAEALRGTPSYLEYRHGARDFAIHLSPLRAPSGEITGYVGAGIDITDRKKSEDEIRHQATHDGLTGLANYREFVDTLEREVRRAERSSHSFAVLLLDLDDLKAINDKYGHLAGNRALRRLSEVIKKHSRVTDLAARYGGDEFAVILIDGDPAMANRMASRLESALRYGRESPALTASMGTSVYPEDGRTAGELLEAADRQLYKRKKAAHEQGVPASQH